ncbi:hypothetical protein L2E82_05438 [Cichorium intybus]|uniref:Uncharacterized protein n=1 Tax=Cichorium intybus TaxID=13427 RepID=A0ACB9H828_CICIN|nr:hypothetical protein L2E82_05438 [Cichorium intybus]
MEIDKGGSPSMRRRIRDLSAHFLEIEKPDGGAMGEFLRPLNDKIAQANSMSEGKRSDFFNHLKATATAESLSALIWIAYTGKGCGNKKKLFFMLYVSP